jgi:DNA modification methylase
MQPFLQDADFTLYVGDVREVLAGLPDESVHCVVTSPPYWGLRDYGTGSWAGGDPDCDHKQGRDGSGRADGIVDVRAQRNRDGAAALTRTTCKCGATRTDQQLGLEPTPELYVANMVAVFREVRRVLRRDGSLWLNIGDSYNSRLNGSHGGWNGSSPKPQRTMNGGATVQISAPGLKPKDLVGIPWRLAFALQADGWYLRSEIIWAKPNPMPESVTDRPTKSHEQVFLLTRSPRYFFDADAVRESAEYGRREVTGPPRAGRSASSSAMWRGVGDGKEAVDAGSRTVRGSDPSAGRNMRSVWEIATQPYPEAHFATYPEALVARCVKAGTSERGACPECGAPWERETDRESYITRPTIGRETQKHKTGEQGANGLERIGGHAAVRVETIGWRPTCRCFPGIVDGYFVTTNRPVPCVVLDPFMGSGTTALVARNLGRHSIGVELNESYAELAGRRTRQLSLLTEGAT